MGRDKLLSHLHCCGPRRAGLVQAKEEPFMLRCVAAVALCAILLSSSSAFGQVLYQPVTYKYDADVYSGVPVTVSIVMWPVASGIIVKVKEEV